MLVDEEKYKKELKSKLDYKILLKNSLQAFFFGGLICLFGQFLLWGYEKLGLDEDNSKALMSITVVVIAGILSALGIYDKIGQIAKCGTIIPLVGFANSMVSSSMEYRSEGFLLGLSANVFKLAGSIIVLGVFFGFVVGLIKYLWSLI